MADGTAIDPLHQFQISPIVSISTQGLGLDFTNSTLFMAIAVAGVVGGILYAMSRRALVPSRGQSVVEMMVEFIDGLVTEHAGPEGKPYVPFVFAIFTLVLAGNLLGMIPGSFTFTSHIVVTATLALIVFATVTVIGLREHGFHFFSFFVPEGAPKALLPLIVPIEIISYLSRPLSLSVRLFANMLAGHVMLKVFASFVVALGSSAALGFAGDLLAILPIALNVLLVGFEILVALLQAYVFALLTSLYLRDAIHLH